MLKSVSLDTTAKITLYCVLSYNRQLWNLDKEENWEGKSPVFQFVMLDKSLTFLAARKTNSGFLINSI